MSNAINRLDVASAITEQEVLAWWQDWYRFLKARLELLDLRAQADDQGFDLDESDTTARRLDLEAALKAIPEQRRTAFEAETEAQRQNVHRRMTQERQQQALAAGGRAAALESQDVERATLAELLDTCQGDAMQQRMGSVPVNGRWWEVDPAALDTVPGEDFYAIGKDRERRPASRWLLVGLLIALIWIGGYFVLFAPKGGRSTVAAVAAPATVNEQRLTTWQPSLAQLVGDGTDPISVTLEPITAAAWPQVGGDAVGGWRSDQVWPLTLCVPSTALRDASISLTLISAGAAPARTYTLSSDAPTQGLAPLRVTACNSDGRTLRYGTLAQIAPLPLAAVGAKTALPDGTPLVLIDARAVGRGQDASVPVDKALVWVDVQTTTPIDWPTVDPTLLLMDGTVVGQSGTVQQLAGDRVRLTHLIDIPHAPLDAVWQITDPTTRRVTRWRVTIAPPRSRSEELAATVRVTDIQAQWHDSNRITIDLTLASAGSTPIVISSEDIVLTQNETRLLTPALIPVTVKPGSTERIALDLVIRPGDALQLTLGGAAYAITIPPEGG